MKLRIFYDGECPLCATEMAHLKRYDSEQHIELQDINAEGFTEAFPYINKHKANKILHAEHADGTLIFGLDVTHKAWSLVGKRPWVAPLRWPLVKPIADIAYKLFARYRHPISKVLSPLFCTEKCNTEKCSTKKCSAEE